MSDILKQIGNTPMVKLGKMNPNKRVDIYCKLEGNNPGGSVKDRTAFGMISAAMERGDLRPGMKILEPTSGNTGIAISLIAGLLGFEAELILPEGATKERISAMEAFGAKVILTPKENGMEGAIDHANELLKSGSYFMLNQFGNPDNPGIHYKTTGPEIWQDTNRRITHFVSAMGTTGTIMGVSKYLKEQDPNIHIAGCQPTDDAHIPGIRKWPEAYLPAIFDRTRIDEVIEVSEANARATTKRLAKEEGIFGGMSSGGAVYGAIEMAKKLEIGTIVCIICDRGDRYLSSDLFS